MASSSSQSEAPVVVSERRGIPAASFVEDVQMYLKQLGLDVNSALAFLQERLQQYKLVEMRLLAQQRDLQAKIPDIEKCLNIVSTLQAKKGTAASASLQVGFYRSTCPSAESIVKASVNRFVSKNPGLAAGLIRLHFHDCFVRGCDASVLLDSTPGSPAEKQHPANNPSLRGFEVIDDAKAKIEAVCPQVVSCADILAFAARDSANKVGGINYVVQAGRRDGRVSLEGDIPGNLPRPIFNVEQLGDIFANKGLSLDEMVTLSGAHSIGLSRCTAFTERLYSFNSTHPQDPSMDPTYASYLKTRCPPPIPGAPLPPLTEKLDTATPNRLDNKYYVELSRNRGLLTSDQTLFTTPSTSRMVRDNILRPSMWATKFASAMVHMGSIDVLTGTQGEIRKTCRLVN